MVSFVRDLGCEVGGIGQREMRVGSQELNLGQGATDAQSEDGNWHRSHQPAAVNAFGEQRLVSSNRRRNR